VLWKLLTTITVWKCLCCLCASLGGITMMLVKSFEKNAVSNHRRSEPVVLSRDVAVGTWIWVMLHVSARLDLYICWTNESRIWPFSGHVTGSRGGKSFILKYPLLAGLGWIYSMAIVLGQTSTINTTLIKYLTPVVYAIRKNKTKKRWSDNVINYQTSEMRISLNYIQSNRKMNQRRLDCPSRTHGQVWTLKIPWYGNQYRACNSYQCHAIHRKRSLSCRDAILGSNNYDKMSPSFSYKRHIINVKPSVQVRNCGILFLS
jgi:hypothetical protein